MEHSNSTNFVTVQRLFSEGSVNDVKAYFERGLKDFNEQDSCSTVSKLGATPLILACLSGKPEMVKAMIEIGADVNHRKREQLSPLFIATMRSRMIPKRIVELLLQNGADVNGPCTDLGMKPIFVAQTKDIMSLLLSYNAEVKLKNTAETCALDIVRTRQGTDREAIDMLINHCATIRFDNGRLLLHRSVQHEEYSWANDIEQIINAYPAAIVEMDPITGFYPFQLAATRTCDLESIYELLRREPNLLVERAEGDTKKETACSRHERCISFWRRFTLPISGLQKRRRTLVM